MATAFFLAAFFLATFFFTAFFLTVFFFAALAATFFLATFFLAAFFAADLPDAAFFAFLETPGTTVGGQGPALVPASPPAKRMRSRNFSVSLTK